MCACRLRIASGAKRIGSKILACECASTSHIAAVQKCRLISSTLSAGSAPINVEIGRSTPTLPTYRRSLSEMSSVGTPPSRLDDDRVPIGRPDGRDRSRYSLVRLGFRFFLRLDIKNFDLQTGILFIVRYGGSVKHIIDNLHFSVEHTLNLIARALGNSAPVFDA